MCGINGIIFKNSKVDKRKILTMNALLHHRGPDQSGYISYKNLLLGHTRLSILDISTKGVQPMTADGRYWIVYNGEIYNYKDIKKNLIEKKYKFYSDTDTEVVLNAYREWGLDAFNKFNGEWALAILDKQDDSLIICRDGIGYKPCYIYEDNHHIAFSSEIKSFASINSLEFNPSTLGINSTSLQSTCKTVFKNIEILKHGRVLKINLNTFSKKIARWDFPLRKLPKINAGYKENVIDFYSLLYQSTKLRLNSDVKIGTSLSGGLDSSAIFALLNSIEKKELNYNFDLDLNPLILNYDGMKTKDAAIDLAKKFNKNYKILNFNDQSLDSVQDLLVSIETTEEFFMQKTLYEHQKDRGIKVSIDGHGADEFLGYPQWIPQLSIELINNISNLYRNIVKFGKTESINQFKNLFGLKERIPDKINFTPNVYTNNQFNDYVEFSEFDNSFQYINEDLDDLNNFSYEQSFTYLMAYCGWFQFFLNKWDRASMSSSIEVRMPFLDNDVRLFSLALTNSVKFRNENTKSILRDAFIEQFPQTIIQQDFKQGLSKQNFNFSKNNKKFIFEIINQNQFKNNSIFNHKKIVEDLSNNINLETIWELSKFYLMKEGFENNYKNINIEKNRAETFNYLKI